VNDTYEKVWCTFRKKAFAILSAVSSSKDKMGVSERINTQFIRCKEISKSGSREKLLEAAESYAMEKKVSWLSIPEGHEGKVEPIKYTLSDVIETIHQKLGPAVAAMNLPASLDNASAICLAI
jgi:hypothetical protein